MLTVTITAAVGRNRSGFLGVNPERLKETVEFETRAMTLWRDSGCLEVLPNRACPWVTTLKSSDPACVLWLRTNAPSWAQLEED